MDGRRGDHVIAPSSIDYLAGSDITNTSYLTGYRRAWYWSRSSSNAATIFRATSHQAGESLKDMRCRPRCRHPDQHQRKQQHDMGRSCSSKRWTGTRWEQLGEILDASSE